MFRILDPWLLFLLSSAERQHGGRVASVYYQPGTKEARLRVALAGEIKEAVITGRIRCP